MIVKTKPLHYPCMHVRSDGDGSVASCLVHGGVLCLKSDRIGVRGVGDG